MKKTHVLKILNGEGGDRPDSDFDPYWLRIGTQIEGEHTSRKDVAKIIAKVHLTEHGSMYYVKLIEMEEELKRTEELERIIYGHK
jgi:hypothetical protein